MKFFIENGMAIGDARFHRELVVWFAEPAGMSELKADDEIVGFSETLFVRIDQGIAELFQACFILLGDYELVRVGPTIGTNSHSFTAVDELSAALAKALPAAEDVVGDAAGGGAIPAFHRLNGPAVANLLAVDGDMVDRLG